MLWKSISQCIVISQTPFSLTHNNRSSGGFSVDVLVAQVQNEGEGAVQESKDAHGHKELSGGREIPSQEHKGGGAAVALRDVIRRTRKSNKERGDEADGY